MMPRLTPGAKALMILHAAAWLITRPIQEQAFALGVLDPAAVLQGEVWRLVTFPWVTGLGPVLFALLLLFFFGPPIEERLGVRGLAWLYVGSTATAGLTLMLMALVVDRPGSLLGPAAASLALLAALARLQPGGTVRLYFVLPIKTLHLLWFTIILYVATMWEAQRFLWPVAAELTAAPLGYWGVDLLTGRMSLADLNPVTRFRNWRYRQKMLKFRVHQGGARGPGPDEWLH